MPCISDRLVARRYLSGVGKEKCSFVGQGGMFVPLPLQRTASVAPTPLPTLLHSCTAVGALLLHPLWHHLHTNSQGDLNSRKLSKSSAIKIRNNINSRTNHAHSWWDSSADAKQAEKSSCHSGDHL